MSKITAKAQTLIHASPESVYEAFVDAAMMRKFWFTRKDQALVEGETVHWYVGQAEDAYAIEVRVKELVKPEKIVIEWGDGRAFTQVQWRIEPANDEITKLFIEETGFTGSKNEIITKALDSTGGFNQVIIALKALLEHDATVNVVDSHV